MKFTNGYWLTKPEYRMLFATQCVRAWREKGTLRSAGMILPFDETDNFPLG